VVPDHYQMVACDLRVCDTPKIARGHGPVKENSAIQKLQTNGPRPLITPMPFAQLQWFDEIS